ncbi:site-specific integrase [uncultured Tateyamaria sp.]|uniref:tyrosine-type recombinase/integrase n=1 Tax=uncultured Tateyamaria sp. TaxID=455651 RepID=UPI00262E2ADE|nr:site-specific integrase [uncultured Tateyamaria sp.]
MKQARVLTDAEIKRVLTYCSGTKHPIRNRLAVMLSHYAGLRVGEIATLTWEQLLDVNGSIRSQFYLNAADTKGKEARLVHVNAKLMAELVTAQNLIKSRNRSDVTGPIIASQRGGHFSANSLAQVFARLYAGVGFTDASSHSGRRWFITELAKKGVTSKTIMELAGHKQLTTTQRYIEVTDQMKAQAVQLL